MSKARKPTRMPTFAELFAKARMDPAAHKPSRVFRDHRKRREANRLRRDIDERRED